MSLKQSASHDTIHDSSASSTTTATSSDGASVSNTQQEGDTLQEAYGNDFLSGMVDEDGSLTETGRSHLDGIALDAHALADWLEEEPSHGSSNTAHEEKFTAWGQALASYANAGESVTQSQNYTSAQTAVNEVGDELGHASTEAEWKETNQSSMALSGGVTETQDSLYNNQSDNGSVSHQGTITSASGANTGLALASTDARSRSSTTTDGSSIDETQASTTSVNVGGGSTSQGDNTSSNASGGISQDNTSKTVITGEDGSEVTTQTGVRQGIDGSVVHSDGQTTSSVGANIGGGVSKSTKSTNDEVTTTVTDSATANASGNLKLAEENQVSSKVNTQVGRSTKNQWTDESGRHTDTAGVSVGGNVKQTGDDLSGNMGLDLSSSTSTTQAIETGSETQSVTDSLSLGGTASLNREEGEETNTSAGVAFGLGHTTEQSTVSQVDGATVQNKQSQRWTSGGKYDLVGENRDASASIGYQTKDATTTTKSDGTVTQGSETNISKIDVSKSKGVQGSHKTIVSDNETIEKLGENTTLSTHHGQTTTVLGAGTTKDEEGNRTVSGEASAKHSLYGQKLTHTVQSTQQKVNGLKRGDKDDPEKGTDNVATLQSALSAAGYPCTADGIFGSGTEAALIEFQQDNGLTGTGVVDADTAKSLPSQGLLGEGAKMMARYNVGSAEAGVSGSATFTKDQIKIKGAPGAKVSLVDGDASIDLPVFRWEMFGEDLDVALRIGVDAAVLAEAKGTVEIDLDKSPDNLNVSVGGGVDLFAGAKAGASVMGSFRWRKQPDYTDVITDFLTNLPGEIDDWMVGQVPDEVWPQASKILVGTGISKVFMAKAGVTGKAGIGATGDFSMGFSGGNIEVSGNLGGTLGLGGDVSTDVSVNAVDGVRLLGIIGMKGVNTIADVADSVREWIDVATADLMEFVDEALEAEKAEGGFSGTVASAVDFLGDSVFNLW